MLQRNDYYQLVHEHVTSESGDVLWVDWGRGFAAVLFDGLDIHVVMDGQYYHTRRFETMLALVGAEIAGGRDVEIQR